MKKYSSVTLACVLFFFVIFSNSAVLADEGNVPDDATELASDEEVIDNLDNGTLYNYNIHHRRPARAIGRTRKGMKKKSFLENISTSVESDFLSKYVFQGTASSAGWVWQPSATIEAYGFGFNAWGDFVMGDIPDQGKINEVDLTLYYDIKVWGLTIHPYMLFCLYPTSNKLSLDYSAYSDIKPSMHLAYSIGPVSVYADLEVYVHPTPGALTLDLGLGLQHEIVHRLGISTCGQVGIANSRFNRGTFNINKTKFNYFEYSLSLPWNAIKGFVVEPNINVSVLLSQELRDAAPGQLPVLVWGGVDLIYNF